jgi:type IV pilus biogenesis protein CpaD/CtpE
MKRKALHLPQVLFAFALTLLSGCAAERDPYAPAAAPAAPALAADRHVNNQDCTKGIDLLAGNLRCR